MKASANFNQACRLPYTLDSEIVILPKIIKIVGLVA